MYISRQSKAYLEKVIGNDQLMSNGACTAAMQGVMVFLGTGATVKVANFNSAGDGIYGLTLNFGGDIHSAGHEVGGWEHGLAIQKKGSELVLYQAWVGSFTLSDWLLLTGGVRTYPSAPYSPMHAQCSAQGMDQWMKMLDSLGGQVSDVERFKGTTQFLFGPATEAVGAMQLASARSAGKALNYHWRYRALKPIDQVGA
jgi:hypothetical protein